MALDDSYIRVGHVDKTLAALTHFVLNNQETLRSVIDTCLGRNSRVGFNNIREFYNFMITPLLLGLLVAGLIGVELSFLSSRLAAYMLLSPLMSTQGLSTVAT